MWQDQVSSSLISSIDCILFSSSLIMPSELALHFMVSDIVATLVGQWRDSHEFLPLLNL